MPSRKDAEKVLALVTKTFASAAEVNGPPKLVENWSWGDSGEAPFAVIWEEGPYQWSMLFPYGGIDEEMTAMVREFQPDAVSTVPDVSDDLPANVFVEAYTPWAIGIYND